MKKRQLAFVFLVCAITVLVCLEHSFAQEQVLTEVTGRVTDTRGNPLENAKITVVEGGDISPVLSDSDGRYKFYLLGSDQIALLATRDNHVSATHGVSPGGVRQADFRLEPIDDTEISLAMTSFTSGERISGIVSGLQPNQLGDHKILVYLLTDRWYVHPFAQGGPGRSYALVDEGGSWRIQTAWRGYQATKIALLLVTRGRSAPPVVDISGSSADQALLDAISTVAALIIDPAPQGI